MNKKYMRLTLKEREEISRGIWANERFADIARRINRPVSTISREVWTNVTYSWCYRAEKAQEKAKELRKKGRRPKKLETNIRLK